MCHAGGSWWCPQRPQSSCSHSWCLPALWEFRLPSSRSASGRPGHPAGPDDRITAGDSRLLPPRRAAPMRWSRSAAPSTSPRLATATPPTDLPACCAPTPPRGWTVTAGCSTSSRPPRSRRRRRSEPARAPRGLGRNAIPLERHVHPAQQARLHQDDLSRLHRSAGGGEHLEPELRSPRRPLRALVARLQRQRLQRLRASDDPEHLAASRRGLRGVRRRRDHPGPRLRRTHPVERSATRPTAPAR